MDRIWLSTDTIKKHYPSLTQRPEGYKRLDGRFYETVFEEPSRALDGLHIMICLIMVLVFNEE